MIRERVADKINYINKVINEEYGHTSIIDEVFNNKKVLIIEHTYLINCKFQNIDCLILKFCELINCELEGEKTISYYSSFREGKYKDIVIADDEKEFNKYIQKPLENFKPVFIYGPEHPNQNMFFTVIDI